MRAEDRRKEISTLLNNTQEPISANKLKELFKVSRQVIVQDIALLRTDGIAIISTNKGYVIDGKCQATRVFKCRHTLDELMQEGNIIIELGGRIEDIFVNHRVYGKISAPLKLYNKTHVEEYYRSLVSGASKPLMVVTDGYHYHTVTADSEERLNLIEITLRNHGFLIET